MRNELEFIYLFGFFFYLGMKMVDLFLLYFNMHPLSLLYVNIHEYAHIMFLISHNDVTSLDLDVLEDIPGIFWRLWRAPAELCGESEDCWMS